MVREEKLDDIFKLEGGRKSFAFLLMPPLLTNVILIDFFKVLLPGFTDFGGENGDFGIITSYLQPVCYL